MEAAIQPYLVIENWQGKFGDVRRQCFKCMNKLLPGSVIPFCSCCTAALWWRSSNKFHTQYQHATMRIAAASQPAGEQGLLREWMFIKPGAKRQARDRKDIQMPCSRHLRLTRPGSVLSVTMLALSACRPISRDNPVRGTTLA
jgi:hypothetical protein